MMASTMRTPGAFVPLESVEWLPEVSTRETPESLLIEAETGEEEVEADIMGAPDYAVLRDLALDELRSYLSRIPPREALALMLHLGLLGYPPTVQEDVAEVLAVRSRQVVSYMLRRARARILYLATRPPLDFDALDRVLSPSQVDVVRLVYETASFREVWRQRHRGASTDRGHSWERTQDRRVKRSFMMALAKVDRRPELAEQSSALRHLLAHLGMLSHHSGKGSRSR